MNKTVLVTGGAGYIGSHTVIELMKSNYDVIIVDNFSNSNPTYLNKLFKLCNQLFDKSPMYYNRDCRSSLVEILSSHKVDAVIHFAAHKAVGESVEKPLEYYDNNINSLISILNDCKNFGIRNIVFSSSCSLYGDVEKLPVDELTSISDPQSPYAYTKLVGERILSDFCRVNPDIKAIALRYFNPVGAHETGLIGEYPISKPNNIIPVICNSIDGDQLTVFGNDYDTKDGSCIRDYIHVTDIANAHYLAVEYMMTKMKDNFDIFNLGSENGVSVLELINEFERVNEVKVNYKIGERRQGDVVKIYSNSTKAKNILGWQTKNTIEEMVSSAWKWYNNSK